MPSSSPPPSPLPAARSATGRAKPLGIGALYLLLGPVVGGGLLALGLAAGELGGGNAKTAGGILLVG